MSYFISILNVFQRRETEHSRGSYKPSQSEGETQDRQGFLSTSSRYDQGGRGGEGQESQWGQEAAWEGIHLQGGGQEGAREGETLGTDGILLGDLL